MPYNAPSALKIVPETGEVLEVGSFGSGGWKWHGGLRSGHYIIAIPSHANFVLRIDPATNEVRLFPTGLIGGCYKWAGGVADCDGNVWTVPGDSAYTLKIVPSSGEVTVIGGLPHTKNKWQNGVCGRDGNVYCIPCDSPQVLCIHTRTGELSLHGDLGPLKHKFQGAYQAEDGVIWALPENCEQIMRMLPPLDDDLEAPRLASWSANQLECEAARRVQRCCQKWLATRCPARTASGDRPADQRLQHTTGQGLLAAGNQYDREASMLFVEALRIVALRQSERMRGGYCAALSLVNLPLFHSLLSDETPQAVAPVMSRSA